MKNIYLVKYLKNHGEKKCKTGLITYSLTHWILKLNQTKNVGQISPPDIAGPWPGDQVNTWRVKSHHLTLPVPGLVTKLTPGRSNPTT